MKNSFNIKNLVVALSLSAGLLLASQADAASRGEIRLFGVVQNQCEISVTVDGKANQLNLVGGENNTKVATIIETCNGSQGYDIKFSSQNKGFMLNAGGAKVEYQIDYDSMQNRQLSGVETLTRNGPQWSKRHDLTVDVAANNQRAAGDYSDVIVVEVVAK
jgi:hypothetical protein